MQHLNHQKWGKRLGRNKRTALLCAIIFTIAILGVLFNGVSRAVTVFRNNQCMVVSSYLTTPGVIVQKAITTLNQSEQASGEIEEEEGKPLQAMVRAADIKLSITADGETVTTTSYADCVSDVLDRMGIELGKHDRVTPSLDTVFSDDTHIVVERVSYDTVVREEPIKHEVVYEDTDTLPIGSEKVKKAGSDGIMQVTYQEQIVDGEITESQVVSATVLKKAQNKIVYRGTVKPEKFEDAITTDYDLNKKIISPLQTQEPIKVDAQGRPVKYKECIKGQATAYTAKPGALTAIGDIAQVGYVAVDPKVIPYGTVLFIRTTDGRYVYGVAKASDTGGFTSGPIDVDLFFNTEKECVQFGVRDVEIYIL